MAHDYHIPRALPSSPPPPPPPFLSPPPSPRSIITFFFKKKKKILSKPPRAPFHKCIIHTTLFLLFTILISIASFLGEGMIYELFFFKKEGEEEDEGNIQRHSHET